ncbi:SLBB domain-containing protein [Shewanella sp. A32]|uniref:SLBB domain-containing protein n=1 Tax=Shewanella sp. A32 TaxID=3031327 RepID=UPI0023B8B6C3|nr:SLBB domain-containing protein [Shewanella sp. A32]MDF0533008.1 SLBB domain-containing protein [Shewanella sp. A32]
MSFIKRKIILALAALLSFGLVQAEAVTISPQMVEQFKSLPKSEQLRLAEQYGIDPSQLTSAKSQSSTQNQNNYNTPVVQPRNDQSDDSQKQDDDLGFIKDDQNQPLKRFGYEMFAGSPTTFAPVSDAPVPSNYMVGPGDSIKVQLYGKDNEQYELTVTREGILQFPGLGPINVNGLSFSELRDVLSKQIKQQMIGVDINITMGELRSIRVFLAGDAYKPGSYTVSSLSTITQALFVSGGVSDIGSLRNIQLKRQGKVVATFDLYDLLLNGDSSKDLSLRSGDVVFIPAMGPTISVSGDVQRPAIYELKPNENLIDVVKMAAGLKPGAYPRSSTIERYNRDGLKSIINVDLTTSAGQKFVAKDGDYLRVKSASSEYDNAITLVGAAVRPGIYQWVKGQKISSLIPTINGDLLAGADLKYALVVRQINDVGDIKVLQFSPARAITDTASQDNVLLMPKDKVVIFNASNNIRNRYELNRLVKDRVNKIQKISKTKGNNSDNSLVNTDLFQSGFSQLGQEKLGQRHQLAGVVLAIDDAAPQESDLVSTEVEKMLLQLFNDRGLIKLSSEFNRQELLYPIIATLKTQSRAGKEAKVVAINGEIQYDGIYPLAEKATVSDLIAAAGGLKEGAYIQRAELTRTYMDADSSSIAHLNVNVKQAMDHEAGADISLQPRDVLTVLKTPEWQETQSVEIRGEVKFPGIYSIRRGETLEQVLTRAGGFTDNAYLPSAVFVRDSIKKQEEIEIKQMADQLRRDIATRGISKDGTVVNYDDAQKMLTDLEHIKAVGRLVIDLPAISLGIKQADLQLEDKDVLYVPAQKQIISVVGEVQHPSTHRFKSGMTLNQYLEMAGGARKRADTDRIYVIKADGSVMMPHNSFWFSSEDNLSAGDTIVVPLDTEYKDNLTLWSQVTSIFYNSAVALAAIANL